MTEEKTKTIGLISVGIDLGAGRRGVDMGPSALRIAGLEEMARRLGHEVKEYGRVIAPDPESSESGDPSARFRDPILAVVQRTHDLVHRALSDGCLPLILGGDHSLSMGSVSGVSRYFRERKGESIGVIWVDAHTDMNTPETSPSGNIHGMPLAVLTGVGGPAGFTDLSGSSPAVPASRVTVLGARDIDRVERENVRKSGVRVITMSEVDERGVAACIEEAIERAMRESAGIHLSFDLDSVDPELAPGVGTPVAGGFNYREAHLICEKVARSGALRSLEVVELNPVLDDRNRSARLAIGLLASALGKTIL